MSNTQQPETRRIRRIRSTAAQVISGSDGLAVMISYNTPVAAFIPGRGYVRTNCHHSPTTSRHINEWTQRTETKVPADELRAIRNRLEGPEYNGEVSR